MDQKTGTSIKVAIKIRPLIAQENENKMKPQWSTQQNVIYQIDDCGQKFGEPYSFDHIFEMNKTNSDIYGEIVQDFVTSSLNGLNSTIFAYGQTSSGKTYTMLGHKQEAGIMSLAIENIFNSIKDTIGRKFLLRVSYIEIYNEKINDLLDPKNKDLKIRELSTMGVGLKDVKEELVSSMEDMYNCLKVGNLNRHIGATKANEKSSRSHTIFKIMIESALCSNSRLDSSSGSVQVSSLNLVDLAGSERVAQTKATGMRLKEGGHINKSLSALSLVIRQLSDGQEFVNFRDSKLTRLLQDSLGGNSKTLIIATITVASLEDTASTLNFAQRAKTVKNKPQVNEILTDADISKRYAALNTQLKKKLEDQLLLNQNLQKTQERSNQEMARLQHQMQMVEDFQSWKQRTVSSKIPKRRHTIGFSGQKPLFSKTSSLDNFGSYENCEDPTRFPNLIPIASTKDPRSSMNTLEPIMEEELATPTPKYCTRRTSSSTIDTSMSTPLSILEEPTFRRDDDSEEMARKITEFEIELDKTRSQWRSREEELCSRISELEEELLCKNVKNGSVLDYTPVEDIMDQLISLQDVLNNPEFLNTTQEIKQEDSVLRIIEKFNTKVKASKDIIEDEILKQMNNFHSEPLDKIIIPNELSSFTELLDELASFENIPVDLVDNMKTESVKDFKVLIKIYESLLRKNDLIKMCSEKIKILEDDQRQKKNILEERKSLKIEVNSLFRECERKSLCQFELEERCTIFEDDMEKLKRELADALGENNSLKLTLEDLKNNTRKSEDGEIETKINKLISKINEKDVLISRLEEDSTRMKQEITDKCLQSAKMITQSKLEPDNQEYCQIIENLQSKIDELTSEIVEKNMLISTQETHRAKFNDDAENLKSQYLNIQEENTSLKLELQNMSLDLEQKLTQKEQNISEIMTECERLKHNFEENRQEIDSFQSRIDVLTSEIREKDVLISELEANSIESRQETDHLKLENCNLLALKFEQENMKEEFESTKNQNIIAENKRLQEDFEKVKLVGEEYRQKVESLQRELEVLTSQINEKNILLSEMDASSVSFKQKIVNLNREYAKVLEENNSLKCEFENVKTPENQGSVGENESLNNDFEKMKRDVEESYQKIDVLICEINEKNILISALEASSVSFKQEKEELNRQNRKIQDENNYLKCEFENIKTNMEIEIAEKQNLVRRNESLQTDVKKVKRNVEESYQKIDALISEINEKNNQISRIESSSGSLKQEKENVNREHSKVLEENKCLRRELQILNAQMEMEVAEKEHAVRENERLKDDFETVKRDVEESRQKIDLLISEINEKNILISGIETSSLSFKQENENLGHQYCKVLEENKCLKCELENLTAQMETKVAEKEEAVRENESLKRDFERVKHDAKECCQKIDALISEINKKNILISGIEASSLSLKQEKEKLSHQYSKVLEENKCLKCELENLTAQIQTKIAEKEEAVRENESLKKDFERVKHDAKECCQKIDILISEINEKNILISGIESTSMSFKQEKEHLNRMYSKVLEGNKHLKCKFENVRAQLEIRIAEKEEAVRENENLKKDFEKMKHDVAESYQKIRVLTSEKNILISELETSSVDVKQEKENLNRQYSKVVEENKYLKCQLENMEGQMAIKIAEKDEVVRENESLKNNFEKVKRDVEVSCQKIDVLTYEIKKKDILISSFETSSVSFKREIENLNRKYSTVLEENNSLKSEFENMKADTGVTITKENERFRNNFEKMKRDVEKYSQKIDILTSEISEKNTLISQLQNISTKCKLEAEDLERKYLKILEDNEKLKHIIGEEAVINFVPNTLSQQNIIKDDLVKRYKQLYESAQVQVVNLKKQLADHDKLKHTVSQYKIKAFTNTKKLEECRQLNEQLHAEINKLKNQPVRTNICDESCSFRSSFKNQEIINTRLVSSKEKLELVLCSIIEEFVSELKIILAVRYTKEQRDHFKDIVRDLKATHGTLKDHLNLLRNHDQCDFAAVSANLSECRSALRKYFNTEKALLKEKINRLDCSNKEYLEEIIALKNQSECIYCGSLKRELSNLKEARSQQEQAFGQLKNRNDLLEKEHVERMKQINDLQDRLYAEQNRKAEVQQSDYLKCLQDHSKIQEQEIMKLKRENEEYRKQSLEEENRKISNYTLMKAKYIKRGQEIAALTSKIDRLNRTGNVGRTIETSSVEVQCDILTT